MQLNAVAVCLFCLICRASSVYNSGTAAFTTALWVCAITSGPFSHFGWALFTHFGVYSKDTNAFTFVVVVIIIISVTVVVVVDYIFKRLVCHGCQRPHDRICGVWPIHRYPALRLQ